jgi:uncharacterized Tic20 family protein
MARDEDDREDDDDDDDDDEEDRKRSKKLKKRAPTKDEKTMAMFCHLGALLGGVILPLILWLTQKEKSSFIDYHGKESVNFELTMLIVHLVGAATACCTFGIINMAAMICAIVFHIQGGMAANRGEKYQYPFCMRMIK